MLDFFTSLLYNIGTEGGNFMLAENLITLRSLNKLTQEEISEKIGISRQAYAKWELGETVPDIEKCDKLASFYGVSIDALVHDKNKIGNVRLAPSPKGKHIFGTVTLGARGQMVIPKSARDVFELTDGDKLVVLGDENEGIALVKAEIFEKRMKDVLNMAHENI